MATTYPADDRASARGLADDIALRLQRALIEGEFRPGQALTQVELCERFGVSRTPVREALQKLHAMHIISLQPNKGARVRVVSREHLKDVYVLRRELEGFACYLACERFTDESLAELRAEHTHERSAQFDDHGRFHELIYRTAGNAALTDTIANLEGFYPRDHAWRKIREEGLAGDVDTEDHARILRAFEARDAQAARSAMEEHMERAAATLLGWLERTGYLAEDGR